MPTANLWCSRAEPCSICPLRWGRGTTGSQGIKLEVEYQACDAYTCFIPKTVELEASLPIVDAGQSVNSLNSALFEGVQCDRRRYGGGRRALRSVRLDVFDRYVIRRRADSAPVRGGLRGGLLNLTPCVLPSFHQDHRAGAGVGESNAAACTWGIDVAGRRRLLAGAGYNDCRHQWIYGHQSAVSVSGVYDPRRHNHRRHGRRHVRLVLHPASAGGLPVQSGAGQPRGVVRVRDYDGRAFHALHGALHGCGRGVGGHPISRNNAA